MMSETIAVRPLEMAFVNKGLPMDVLLHIGAHRCATTSFQNYLRKNAEVLKQQRIGFWGPRRTRDGLLQDILPKPDDAEDRDQPEQAIRRLRRQLDRSGGQGLEALIVSDENMLGSMRKNLRLGDLYCGAGERMARFDEAFDRRIRHVVLNIRALDTFWTSALTFGLARGHGMPSASKLAHLADNGRSWRDVITDVAYALPDARIWVAPFETFAGRADLQWQSISGAEAPNAHARTWLNASLHLPQLRDLSNDLAQDWALPSGDGRWQPFSQNQSANLREAYADDLMWLAGGADGVAQMLPDPADSTSIATTRVGQSPPLSDMTRGIYDDRQERRVARAR